ncbi:MAG: PKD domain-containing protein [Tannerella sp.]|jgi:glycerophosphoryl diester phosphodiesterase|nr:PKD domain-containing protein [Tannerella sp.]
MKRTIYLIALVFIVLSCNDGGQNNEYELPVPGVEVSNPVPCLGEEVQFYFQSDVSASPVWDFGDGTTSTDALVKHAFTEEKQYDVTLTLSDGAGGKVTVHTTIEVMGKSLQAELQRLVSTPSEIWLCAHRGNTHAGKQNGIPENSIEAIQKAIEAGADMVEIDVRTTADGHFVLMHDATVNRTTNASGNVKDKTLAQLKSYKLRAANGTLTSCTVPSLEEALLTGRGKIFFNLDKIDEVNNKRKLVALVDSLHMLDRALFYVSSDKEAGSELRNINPKVIVFPWVSNITAIDSWSVHSNIHLVQLDYKGAEAANLITTARTKQMVAYSNTLDNAGDNEILRGNFSCLLQIKSLQLQVIQSDYPEIIKNYLK